MKNLRSRFRLAGALFFLSGALGLGYELIWIRKAALVVGASQIALSTVLTTFFLGLGIGGLVVGRRLRTARISPLRIYGLFEIGIGLYALAFPSLFVGIETLYGLLYPAVAGSAAALFVLRFLLLFALCLPPTFLMGGTLPLLLDGLVREDRGIGSQTSLLYGLNILGAVAGVIATSYLAIPSLGMNGTSRAAGLCNLLLGAAALWLFRDSRPLHDAGERLARPAPRFVALAFSTGAVAIAWQICHARFFSLLDVTTVYGTAMLLALWLLGLALGSLVLSPLLRRRVDPLGVVAGAQLLVPLAGLYTFRAAALVDFSFVLGAQRSADGGVVPIDTMQVLPKAAFWSEELDAIFFGPLVQIGLVVLAPVVLMGVCLPALIAAATRRAAGLRAVSGSLVFWNTLGSSTGAFAAGYLLLPLLGLHRTLAAIAIASLAVGVLAWRARGGGTTSGTARLAPAALLAAGTLATVGFLLLGGDLTRYAIETFGYEMDGEERLAEVVEGAVGTAYVYDSDDHVLLASGAVAFASASKHGPSAQAIQGHLPVLFFPGKGTPQRCLGIGIGSGQSFGALLRYPVESLDVVDIFPGLVELSLAHFEPYNHGLGNDERVRFHFDDGRHFVERAPTGHYDVVSMEPPPPRADGVYSLYSADFYREVSRILTPRGVFMQWLPMYRVTPKDALGIIATQASVFPATFVMKQGDEDFMVLSYTRRPTFDVAEIRLRAERFAEERMLSGRKWSPRCAHEIASFEGIASMILTGPETIARLEVGEVYRDDTQRLAYGTGDRWLLRRYRAEVSRISFASVPQTPISELAGYYSPPLDAAQIATVESERAAALEFYSAVDPLRLERWEAMARNGENRRARVRGHLSLAAAHDVRLHKSESFDRLRSAVEIDPGNDDPRDVELARRIVRNHYAVYRDETAGFVDQMRRDHPEVPLVLAMVEVYDAVERIEVERRSRYLFPDR